MLHARASRGEAVREGRVVYIFTRRSPVGAGDDVDFVQAGPAMTRRKSEQVRHDRQVGRTRGRAV